MRTIYRKMFILTACAFGLQACRDNVARMHSPSDPKYHISIHLHPGDKYYYIISGDMQSRSDVKDKKIESASHSDLGLIYEVLSDSADSIRLRITYDKLHIRLKSGELEKDVTARKGGAAQGDPIEGLLGNILGSQLTVTLDNKGNVIGVEGGKELSDKILGAIDAPGSADNKQIIRQQMEKLVGEKSVRNTLQEAFRLFPDTAIYVGDDWVRKGQQSEDVKIGSNQTYSFTSLKGNIARVDERSDLTKEDDGNISIMGHDVPTDIDGEQTGFYEMDVTSGMLMNGESDLSLKGTLHVLGMEVPVKIKTAKKISGKRI